MNICVYVPVFVFAASVKKFYHGNPLHLDNNEAAGLAAAEPVQ